jgi:hypothetical protein
MPTRLTPFAANCRSSNTNYDFTILRKGKTETIKNVTIPKPADKPKKGEVSDSDKPAPAKAAFESMAVKVNNDTFEIDASNADLQIAITGHFENGKSVADTVKLTKDGKEMTTKELDKLSKSDRAIVEQLLKNVRGGGDE